jgi:hypothetical protein
MQQSSRNVSSKEMEVVETNGEVDDWVPPSN